MSDLKSEVEGKYPALGAGEDDLIDAGSGNDIVSGGEGADLIQGGGGDDFLFGDSGEDQIRGNNGNDVIFGGSGADLLDGGADYDIAAYWFSTSGLRIDMKDATKSTGDAEGDTFTGIEEIQGSYYNDTIIGSDATAIERIVGDQGDDLLFGGGSAADVFGGIGNDTVVGGGAVSSTELHALDDEKRDYLYGEDGNDTFVIGIH